MIEISYDPQADAAYIQLGAQAGAGEIELTRDAGDGILLDFDRLGRLRGVEVLEASGRLEPHLLAEALRRPS